MADIKNVFVSHVHKDDQGLQKLKDLLAPKGMDIRDSSIHTGKFNNATDPNYIKTQILAPAINWSSIFICYVSPQTKYSDWVNWEIEYAAKQGKRIIGVWEHGEKECDLPAALQEYADALVGWTGMQLSTQSTAKTVGKNLMVALVTQCRSNAIPVSGPHLFIRSAL